MVQKPTIEIILSMYEEIAPTKLIGKVHITKKFDYYVSLVINLHHELLQN